MLKLREYDCGSWDTFYDHNRITVRERGDGLFDLVHVRYVRTREGMQKIESHCGLYADLHVAREAGYKLFRGLRGW